MNAIAKQARHEDCQAPTEAFSSPFDLLTDDELLENIVDVINENFMLEVEATNASVERDKSVD